MRRPARSRRPAQTRRHLQAERTYKLDIGSPPGRSGCAGGRRTQSGQPAGAMPGGRRAAAEANCSRQCLRLRLRLCAHRQRAANAAGAALRPVGAALRRPPAATATAPRPVVRPQASDSAREQSSRSPRGKRAAAHPNLLEPVAALRRLSHARTPRPLVSHMRHQSKAVQGCCTCCCHTCWARS